MYHDYKTESSKIFCGLDFRVFYLPISLGAAQSQILSARIWPKLKYPGLGSAAAGSYAFSLPIPLFFIAAAFFLGFATTGTRAQEPKTAVRAAWIGPRTPDGQPDLQGYWTDATFT